MLSCGRTWTEKTWNEKDNLKHVCDRQIAHGGQCRCRCEPVNWMLLEEEQGKWIK